MNQPVSKKMDCYWMHQALKQARKAELLGEVPVGALLIDASGQLLASGHSASIRQHDPTAHAELIVIRKAGKRLRNYRLLDTTLYTSLEPCMMCLGAIHHARIGRLVYGAPLKRFPTIDSRSEQRSDLGPPLHSKLEICSGCLADESANLLTSFFQTRRHK